MSASPRPGLSEHLGSWHPEPAAARDVLSAAPVAALSAVLDQPGPVAGTGDPLPPLWHWLYFLEWPSQSELGRDGHPRHGHFLPPIPNRARMVAGGRIDMRRPLLIGAEAHRTSTLGNVSIKQGKSGEMAFVTVRHEISQDSQICLVEEHDLVYRSVEPPVQPATRVQPATPETAGPETAGPATGGPVAGAVPPPAPAGEWRLSVRPDPPLLFRFSALTANAHRIHYDEPYTRNVEGFPGLVVHGPLLVVLMLEPVRRDAPGERVRSLSYRLRRPVFLGDQVHAVGDPAPGRRAALRIDTDRASEHATAEVTFA